MVRIPEETIARIRDTADILDVVSGYVQLKRRGRNYFGLCPFHQEKTPSFSVNQQKQIFHCFGCGRGGNAITFIMELEKVEFVEAVQRLGERYGIPVELTGTTDPRRKATVQQILDLYELATGFYQNNLRGKSGEKVRAYLEQRGITEASQTLFRIGYAPPGWDNLWKAVSSQKFSHEALNQSGLFTTTEKGTFDRFRSRIMFPITNIVGRVVAFGGRVFESDDLAKYVNSPETPVYHKSEVLYGLALTRDKIRDQEAAFVVEGYLDLIQLHQAGIHNIVAGSGTALTDRHARELRKLTPNIFLAYDGDTAGIQAAIRGGYTLLRNGLDPRVVPIPADVDPDDWVQQEGPEPLLKAAENAVPLIDFHLSRFQGDVTNATDMRRFLDEALVELAQIRDPLVRELHLKRLAEITNLDERPIREALGRIPRMRPREDQDESSQIKDRIIIEPTRLHRAQMALIRLAFQENDLLLNLLLDHTTTELFTHPTLKTFWEMVVAVLQEGKVPAPGAVMDQLASEQEQRVLSEILMSDETTADETGDSSTLALAIDCLTVLHRESLKQRIEQRRLDLRQAEKQTGASPADIVAEVADLQRQLTSLPRKFDQYRSG